MTTTNYAVNHPLAVKLWSRKLFQETMKQCWISKFTGNDSSALIQVLDDTSKGPGDQITIGLRMLLQGDGVQGDGSLEGQEEALTTYHFSLVIDQLRHAVRSAGKMSEQRVPFSLREEARQGLQDWWSDRLDMAFFNQLCGFSAQADTRYTGNQPAKDADKAHIIRPNALLDDESLTDKDTFSLTLIDKAVEQAKTLSPMIRPLRIKGENKYVMFLHPFQVSALRSDTNKGQWMDIQKAALSGGKIKDNPIYTGALGEYNGVILHEAPRITCGVNSKTNKPVDNVRRSVLCGAQSLVMAFGQNYSQNKVSWTEESFDYDNQLGVSAGMIFGLKKTKLNDKDFATIIVPTYAKAQS